MRETSVFNGKRPILLNGIAQVVRKSDILNRCLLIDLPPIPDKYRRYDKEVWAQFYEKQPGILGALLDAVSAGLGKVDSVELDDKHKSRLIDFDRWAVACEEALGIKKGTYLEARHGSRERSSAEALEAEPVWEAIYTITHKHTEAKPLVTTMKQLLQEVNDEEDDDVLKRSKDWPKTPEKLRSTLNMLAPPLLDRGVHFEKAQEKRSAHGQLYKLYGTPADR
jgi:putative DNA primase/helicase